MLPLICLQGLALIHFTANAALGVMAVLSLKAVRDMMRERQGRQRV